MAYIGSQPISPAQGGTGIDNNNASTIAISGAFPLTLTLTGSTNVTLPTSGTLLSTTSAGVFTWSVLPASPTTVPFVINTGYICSSSGVSYVIPLPAVSPVGSVIKVTLSGATSWQVTQTLNAGQQIQFGNLLTTSGSGGSITSTAQGDSLELVCKVANTMWVAYSSVGNPTVV